MEILTKECTDRLFAGTKISFVTADAGHGKTALLREFQYEQAQKYVEGKSNFYLAYKFTWKRFSSVK